MKNIIVWDLFGGGQNSVFKALFGMCYDIYTIDVTPTTRKQHLYFDLSSKKNDLIKFFNKLPKPDIIVSSTLCQSFSSIRSMKGGGTCGWVLKNNKLVLRQKDEFEKLKSGFSKNQNFVDVNFIAKLGKKCIDNTIFLIQHYQPKAFYIENPRNSLIWKYIETNHYSFYKQCVINKTNYGEYGFLTLKPTIFLSNVKMDLLYTPKFSTPLNKKCQINRMNIKKETGIDIGLKCGGFTSLKKGKNYKKQSTIQLGESGENSSIPKKLIVDIFSFLWKQD